MPCSFPIPLPYSDAITAPGASCCALLWGSKLSSGELGKDSWGPEPLELPSLNIALPLFIQLFIFVA